MEIIAHRGLHAGRHATENSLPAILAAARAGFNRIEVDVRACGDGDLFLLHDPFLDRTTEAHGRLDRLSAADAAAIRLTDGSPLPRIGDAIDAARDAVLCLDVKEAQVMADLRKALAACRHRVEVWSSRRHVVRAARDDGITAALISNGIFERGIGAFLWQAAECGAQRVSFYPADVEPHVAAACANVGLAFMSGTPNDVDTWRFLAQLNAFGVITDRPVQCREALGIGHVRPESVRPVDPPVR